MTDAEKIEQAAKAIYEVFANRSGRARGWESISAGRRNEHLREAEAALRAAGAIA